MTLVVTTASTNGISVVGDKAVTRTVHGVGSSIAEPSTKIFYSSAANISLACWGSTRLDGSDYSQWMKDFVANRLTRGIPLEEACRLLATDLNAILDPIAASGVPWSDLRRGVHVAGFESETPCVFHVHTGDPRAFNHRLEVHRDFPDIHGGGAVAYRERLQSGTRFQLFNGFHNLFGAVGAALEPLRHALEAEFDTQIPEPTLQGQLEYDRTLVRLAAGLLRAGGHLPQISLDIESFSFNHDGLAAESALDTTGKPLSRAVNAKVQTFDTSSRWDGGQHGDAPGREAT